MNSFRDDIDSLPPELFYHRITPILEVRQETGDECRPCGTPLRIGERVGKLIVKNSWVEVRNEIHEPYDSLFLSLSERMS